MVFQKIKNLTLTQRRELLLNLIEKSKANGFYENSGARQLLLLRNFWEDELILLSRTKDEQPLERKEIKLRQEPSYKYYEK